MHNTVKLYKMRERIQFQVRLEKNFEKKGIETEYNKKFS
jgi:hypothetical protein